MVLAIFYILYCGITDQLGTPLYVALAIVSLECVVFVGNGMKCPLTGLAKTFGAEKGYVFDTFIPETLTRYTVPVFGTLFGVGLALLFFRLFH